LPNGVDRRILTHGWRGIRGSLRFFIKATTAANRFERSLPQEKCGDDGSGRVFAAAIGRVACGNPVNSAVGNDFLMSAASIPSRRKMMKKFGVASLFVALTFVQVGCEEPASTSPAEPSAPAAGPGGTMSPPADAVLPADGAATPAAEGETTPAAEGEAPAP